MTVAEHDLNCETRAPLRARQWTADCLRHHLSGDPADLSVIDDAVLCVSELVTNAVHAGCSTIRLQLAIQDSVVRLAVLDDAPGRPAVQPHAPTAASGRGLRLVEAISAQWGVDPAASGKSVWAELSRVH
jgi:anti-sigma regulatory factor (Ser/Thr protein kinase)